MGKEMYCDLCRVTVAIEAGLKPVLIGESKICEVCLTCASRLEQSLKKQIADNETAVMIAKKAAQAPKAALTEVPSQGHSVLSDAEIKAKIKGGE